MDNIIEDINIAKYIPKARNLLVQASKVHTHTQKANALWRKIVPEVAFDVG
jgi:hypothetical protein